MAALDLQLGYKALNAVLDQVTSVLSSAVSSDPGTPTLALGRISTQCKLLQDGITARRRFQASDWNSVSKDEWERGGEDLKWESICSGPGGEEAGEQLLSQHALSVTAYAAFLNVAVQRLQHLDRIPLPDISPSATAVLDEFSFIWDLVVSIGSFQNGWPFQWPGNGLVFNLSLYAALNRLMKWHVFFFRGRTHTRAFIVSNLGVKGLHFLTLDISSLAMTVIRRLENLPGKTLRIIFAEHPSTYFSTLCCFASDRLGSGLRARASRPQLSRTGASFDKDEAFCGDVLFNIITPLGRCFGSPESGSENASDAWGEEQYSPALLEASKLAVLACMRTQFLGITGDFSKVCESNEGRWMTMQHALNILTLMLRSDLQRDAVFQGSRPSTFKEESARLSATGSSSSSSSSSSDTPVISAHLLPCHTTSNLLLLTALRECSEQFPLELGHKALIVTRMLVQLVTCKSLASDPAPQFPFFVSALVCILRHSETWMQRFVLTKIRVPALPKRERQRREQRQQRLSFEPRESVMTEVREMMESLLNSLQSTMQHGIRTHSAPSYLVLRQWLLLPGSASTVEALLRCEHGQACLSSARLASFLAATRFMQAVLATAALESTYLPSAMLTACTSLSATMRKLLCVQTSPQDLKLGSTDSSYHHFNLCGKEMAALLETLALVEAGPAGCTPSFSLTLTSGTSVPMLEKFAVPTSDGSNRGGSKDSLQHSEEVSTCLPTVNTITGKPPAVKPFLTSPFRLHKAGVLRLQTSLFVTRARSYGCWKHITALGVIKAVDSVENQQLLEAERAQLADYLSQLIPSPQVAEGVVPIVDGLDSKFYSMWGAFSLEHFEGRLLPGCCYLSCTNLSGVSEASLLTQLCSGCRRARYCSIECQRGAWLHEGHGRVCCKGGWAPNS